MSADEWQDVTTFGSSFEQQINSLTGAQRHRPLRFSGAKVGRGALVSAGPWIGGPAPNERSGAMTIGDAPMYRSFRDGETVFVNGEKMTFQRHPSALTEAELFDRVCKALWGELYVAPAAFALGAEKNTIGKLRNGKSRISPGIWAHLASLLRDRHSEIGAVQLELSSRGKGSVADLPDHLVPTNSHGVRHAAEPFTPEPAQKKPHTSG
ncbi:hypothetical protein [Nitrobacter sp.]|uniref:hypothetical protein n=1 Tax=Nitrobacter sp. TaxID=29420 RepID=UPI0029CAB7AE|nr:hypothetical protein [Nitrobacter sp.]